MSRSVFLMKLFAESKTQSDEDLLEPNVKLEGGIKNCRRGNWTRVKNTRGKELVILARNKERKRRYLIKRAEALNKQLGY
jgi:hypothetical protein